MDVESVGNCNVLDNLLDARWSVPPVGNLNPGYRIDVIVNPRNVVFYMALEANTGT